MGIMKTTKEQLESTRFYGIVDAGYVREGEMLAMTQQLIDGGAGVIQLRAKEWRVAQIEEMAQQLCTLCHQNGVIFIVNDFAEVALAVGADGLHIGQGDGSLESARSIVGDAMLIGRSTHSVEQALTAVKEGFHYIGFGPLFVTPTKPGRPAIGLDSIATVIEGVDVPVFCIGGIHRENMQTIVQHGAKRVVVVADVLLAADPKGAVKEILMSLDN